MVSKYLFCLFVISCSESLFTFTDARLCVDCISISSCEPGLRFAQLLYDGDLPDTSRQTFFNALCGYDTDNPKIPKVCCSDFPVSMTVRAFDQENVASDKTLDPIETHPNVGLLPLECGDIDGSRIINGEIAKLYEFPWMTLIAYETTEGPQFRCGGSIINSRYILTAAHCVVDRLTGKLKKNVAWVRIGEFDYYTDIDCQGDYQNMICESKIQDIEIAEIIPHKNFNGQPPIGGDIALIRLSETITMENNAAPICLPIYSQLRSTRLAGLNGTVAGWGATEHSRVSNKLMKVNIPIKSGDDCNSYYNKYENQKPLEKIFCAGQIRKDSCSGDSGGPLMVEADFNGSIRLIQFGVVSFGPKQCGSTLPGVYTDVTKYMDWILDNIKP